MYEEAFIRTEDQLYGDMMQYKRPILYGDTMHLKRNNPIGHDVPACVQRTNPMGIRCTRRGPTLWEYDACTALGPILFVATHIYVRALHTCHVHV